MADRVVAIRAQDVVVDYEVFEDRRAALRDRLLRRGDLGRDVVHAVRGVSFDVYEGESVAVIGTNGSGKSTLLAALAGLLPITSGTALVSEEPKLLGVGAALIPGASGRRNVRLGLLAIGVPHAELDERVEAVIDWTELGDAIHRPLRTYSSGMRARLHFGIATSMRPRILLVDEALGVGDKRFRRKSKARMAEIQSAAGVLMVVNHNLNELRNMCERALWIEQGRLVADGPIDAVLESYELYEP